jgi:hypothetical protein
MWGWALGVGVLAVVTQEGSPNDDDLWYGSYYDYELLDRVPKIWTSPILCGSSKN